MPWQAPRGSQIFQRADDIGGDFDTGCAAFFFYAVPDFLCDGDTRDFFVEIERHFVAFERNDAKENGKPDFPCAFQIFFNAFHIKYRLGLDKIGTGFFLAFQAQKFFVEIGRAGVSGSADVETGGRGERISGHVRAGIQCFRNADEIGRAHV